MKQLQLSLLALCVLVATSCAQNMFFFGMERNNFTPKGNDAFKCCAPTTCSYSVEANLLSVTSARTNGTLSFVNYINNTAITTVHKKHTEDFHKDRFDFSTVSYLKIVSSDFKINAAYTFDSKNCKCNVLPFQPEDCFQGEEVIKTTIGKFPVVELKAKVTSDDGSTKTEDYYTYTVSDVKETTCIPVHTTSRQYRIGVDKDTIMITRNMATNTVRDFIEEVDDHVFDVPAYCPPVEECYV